MSIQTAEEVDVAVTAKTLRARDKALVVLGERVAAARAVLEREEAVLARALKPGRKFFYGNNVNFDTKSFVFFGGDGKPFVEIPIRDEE